MHESVWLGRGGQGAFTAARLLGLAAVRFAGRHALAFPSFGPERRGAPVWGFVRISDDPIHDRGTVMQADAAIILDASLVGQVSLNFLRPETLVIMDDSTGVPPPLGRVVRVPAREMARELLGTEHTNTVLLGFLIGLTGLLPVPAVQAAIEADFGHGGRASSNADAFLRAVEHSTGASSLVVAS
ncbi:2-oxoacid:acceptor oxidoreductase family protein [Ectothiorhodospira lacustris]|uniref:2-oxoacid:acceptor oxidoreductase family protein n=1 Tax=Ectothiorhodospira lacustris TaxID=2899127 RepID=UPI001EE93472|nr:2-oxoacid:acceptor oxidoreductase family protein [Ectothiorhodospira lacustris]MCG5501338.1 2-oxoacid:acceptor oxidoreductase family protein [Ectothiorhodospira lacustris]